MNYDNLHYYNNLSSPQFHTDPSLKHISSTQGPHLFSTQNLSVQNLKALSLTPKTPQFHATIPQFYTKNLSVPHTPQFKLAYIKLFFVKCFLMLS